MSWRSVGLGAGIGSFVIVTYAVAELLEGLFEFSVFVGAPVGLVAGALAIMFSYRWTRADATGAQIRAVAGAAGFGYTLLALYLLKYATGALDGLLTPTQRILYAGLAVGVLAALVVPPGRLRGTD